MNTASPTPTRPYTFDRVVRLIITGGSIVLAVWLVSYLRSVLLPFLVAWLIAYMLEPFVQYNRRLLGMKGRVVPIFVTLFECILLIAVVAIFLLPSVIEQSQELAKFVRHYSQWGSEISFIPPEWHDYIRSHIDFESISRHLTHDDIEKFLNTAMSVISGGYDIVLALFSWFMVVLYVLFIMIDYERLIVGFKRLVPPKYRQETFRIVNDIKDSMNHYFRGQALVAALVGVLFCIGFSLIDLPLAIVLGLFIGVLNMVPYLQLISLVPTTLLCLVVSVQGNVDFWEIWLESMGVYIVVQCIQDLYLVPKIMGKTMGLNPAIILFSLSLWGALLGFIGLIIALPMTTLLLSYYDIYITNREDDETAAEHAADAAALRDIVEFPPQDHTDESKKD